MKRTILLADDDDAIRTMLGRALESENYNVIYARTGCEAASQFIVTLPDLVLLDLNMPEKDGWEAWCLMTAINPLVPVIIITARSHQHEKAVSMKIDALMEKPLDLPLLLGTMEALLGERDEEHVAR